VHADAIGFTDGTIAALDVAAGETALADLALAATRISTTSGSAHRRPTFPGITGSVLLSSSARDVIFFY
jgi:hypothetical protein